MGKENLQKGKGGGLNEDGSTDSIIKVKAMYAAMRIAGRTLSYLPHSYFSLTFH